MYEWYCVFDFEATCDIDMRRAWPREVVQIGAVMIHDPISDSSVKQDRKIVDTYNCFVKPVSHPVLTKFCSKLLGIPQETIDSSVGVVTAIQSFMQWAADTVRATAPTLIHVTNDEVLQRVLLVTLGDWDFNDALPLEMARREMRCPPFFRQWHNVQRSFAAHYKHKASGLATIMLQLGLPIEGRVHDALDDCKNISKIVFRLLEDGHSLEPHHFLPENHESVVLQRHKSRMKRVESEFVSNRMPPPWGAHLQFMLSTEDANVSATAGTPSVSGVKRSRYASLILHNTSSNDSAFALPIRTGVSDEGPRHAAARTQPPKRFRPAENPGTP